LIGSREGLAMDRRQFCWTMFSAATAGAAASAWAYTPPKIRWHKDLRTAHGVAVQQNKPMLILFSASWCTYCHKLLRETLGEKPMVVYVERHFVPVLLDFDKDDRIAKILEVDALPCTVVLSPQADLILRKNGYAKAEAFRETLQTALQAQSQKVAGKA
jgi:thioredoxin-like negative regulator of GroEL